MLFVCVFPGQVQAPLSRHLAQLEGLGSGRRAAFDQTPRLQTGWVQDGPVRRQRWIGCDRINTSRTFRKILLLSLLTHDDILKILTEFSFLSFMDQQDQDFHPAPKNSVRDRRHLSSLQTQARWAANEDAVKHLIKSYITACLSCSHQNSSQVQGLQGERGICQTERSRCVNLTTNGD